MYLVKMTADIHCLSVVTRTCDAYAQVVRQYDSLIYVYTDIRMRAKVIIIPGIKTKDEANLVIYRR